MANNAFVDSGYAHHDGWGIAKAARAGSEGKSTPRRSYLNNTWRNNLFWPDGPAMFCYGLCAWPGQLPCKNCTDFRAFEKSQPHATQSLLANALFVDARSPPQGLRPRAGSPLLGAGMDVGLNHDWAGVRLPHGGGAAPSIGVFQAADRAVV